MKNEKLEKQASSEIAQSRGRPYENPNDPRNGKAYRTGKMCIEGCGREAGTAWSKYWCQPCNAERINRISDSLREGVSR